jgi:hypothetical protein
MAKNEKKVAEKKAKPEKEKKVKTAKKSAKKDISLSDVKDAKEISKNLFEIVPEENEKGAIEVETTENSTNTEIEMPMATEETPLDILKSRLNKVIEEVKDEVISIQDEEVIEEEIKEEPKIILTPEQQLQENFLEKWWTARNKPANINHFELANSGLNINAFGASEGRIGKFKFTRRYAGDNWQITIE